jgi:hypothetical protein
MNKKTRVQIKDMKIKRKLELLLITGSMSTTGVDESEGQCQSTLYLYPKYLFYLACVSSHLYGCDLNLKLLGLHSKLSKGCVLKSKASLKRWLGP